MTDTMWTHDPLDQLNVAMGQQVRTPEGARAGTIDRVVVSPTLSRMTHLVIRSGPMVAPKLVPVQDLDLVDGELTLIGLTPWPDGYEDAETIELLELTPTLAGPDLAWPLGGTYVWPWLDEPTGPRGVLHQHLPPGEIAIGVGCEVRATDGPIGHLAAFVTEPATERVTHVVLRHGHLWGRKTVVVPIDLARATPDGDLELDVGRADLDRFVV